MNVHDSFSLQPEKFPKRFSFGGGRVRFFLLCIPFLLASPPINDLLRNHLRRVSKNGFQGAILSGVAPANQTKERSVHELFAGAFRNKSSM